MSFLNYPRCSHLDMMPDIILYIWYTIYNNDKITVKRYYSAFWSRICKDLKSVYRSGGQLYNYRSNILNIVSLIYF